MAVPCTTCSGAGSGAATSEVVVTSNLYSLPRQVLDTNHPGNISGLDGFLAMVVDLAGAQGGAIRALTLDGEYLRLMASVGLSDDFLQRELLVGVCGACGDAVRDDDIRTSSDSRGCGQLATACRGKGTFQQMIAVPLEYKGEPVGVFNLFFDHAEPAKASIKALLRPIGQLLGLTLENMMLERENSRARLVTERQTMATDIHDSLAQTLAFARMRMPLVQDAIRNGDRDRALTFCGEVNEELGRAHRGLRELITHFRAGLDARGLGGGLREVVARFREGCGIDLDFDNHIPDLKLPGESEVQVFFIVQEALANIRKHAKATRARLAVESVGEGVEILVEDNGCGLIAEHTLAATPSLDTGSYGLRIMRERAERFGGCVAFENLPKGGTRVRVFVPERAAGSRRASA